MDNEQIQKAGANARAIGKSKMDNPYYKPENMPAATGEPIREWETKAQLWDASWDIEDAMREGQP
jgi:hypothetical protein